MCSGPPKQQGIPVMLTMNIPRDVSNYSTKAVLERKNQLLHLLVPGVELEVKSSFYDRATQAKTFLPFPVPTSQGTRNHA